MPRQTGLFDPRQAVRYPFSVLQAFAWPDLSLPTYLALTGKHFLHLGCGQHAVPIEI
jgi:hypothetical protein